MGCCLTLTLIPCIAWYTGQALSLGFLMTFFSVFDVPVYWPILLMYFIVLFVLTMKRQVK